MKARDIWCREEERQLSNDCVISYENRQLQLELRHDMPTRARVLVRVTEDGLLRVVYRTRQGAEHEFAWRDYQKPAPLGKRIGLSEKAIAAHKARHPAANHPWRNTDYRKVKEAFDQRMTALNPTEVPWDQAFNP